MSETSPTQSILFLILVSCCFLNHPSPAQSQKKETKIKVLLIDGQSINHKNWKEWSPILLKQLDESGLFIVDIATSPISGESMDRFNPRFKKYDVVVTTYDGDKWPARIRNGLENFVRDGGGLVVVHAANHAFPEWDAYNFMIGLGGGEGRSETTGSYLYINDNGDIILDKAPGSVGKIGDISEFIVETRSQQHPIMQGIPTSWKHSEDALYSGLRGPANMVGILATAYSDLTQRHEPVLMSIKYGEGNVFHTTMGHSKRSISCVGFLTTFIRGCEWAATGNVTFEIPADFPDENTSSNRTF